MKDDLFLAILAMDAYNRGYRVGLDLSSTSGSKAIGAATFYKDSSDPKFFPADDAQAAGFYSVAYQWGDKTVISYRGTDNRGDGDPAIVGGSDIWNGWVIGAGELADQAALAEQFYKTVTGQSGSYPTNAPNVF
jgi:hypothetical protein